MYYEIKHTTSYTYNQAVWIKPHLLRLRPRCNSWQTLKSFSLQVEPQPVNVAEFIDLDGNNLIKLWFNQPTEKLNIQICSEVETHQDNPFIYLLENWSVQLPFDYPSSWLSQLQPYLQPSGVTFDPVAVNLAREIYQQTHGKTVDFLAALNQHLFKNLQYLIRDTGDPFLPGTTWNLKRGSCRDFTVLFMEVCRVMGIPARFVSGYEEGDVQWQQHYLHGWAEVYLPGAGWRGYDPTHGLVVSSRHIALASSAMAKYAAPVEGTVTPVKSVFEGMPNLESQMEIKLNLNKINP
jgi:transglutaminase-like putative cysteine protease